MMFMRTEPPDAKRSFVRDAGLRDVHMAVNGGRQVFRLAGNQPDDPYLPRIDWIRRTFAINYGNYGVIYHARLSRPQGGPAYLYRTGSTRGVCGFAGAVRLHPSGRIVQVPAEGAPVLRDPRDAVLLAELPKGRESVPLRFHATRRFVPARAADCGAGTLTLLCRHPLQPECRKGRGFVYAPFASP